MFKSTKLALLCAVAAAVLIGVVLVIMNSREDERAIQSSLRATNTTERIHEDEDLQSILQSPKLILYVDVDWSANAVYSRPFVAQFRDALEKDDRFAGVVFRRVDLTHQTGPIWDSMEKWLSDQGADPGVMSSGGGSLVWARAGKVIDSLNTVVGVDIKNLVEITGNAFPASVHFGRTSE